jgi:hypothetical protein
MRVLRIPLVPASAIDGAAHPARGSDPRQNSLLVYQIKRSKPEPPFVNRVHRPTHVLRDVGSPGVNDIDHSNSARVSAEEIAHEIPQNQIGSARSAINNTTQQNLCITIPFDVKSAPAVGFDTMDLCPPLCPTTVQFFMDGQPEGGNS